MVVKFRALGSLVTTAMLLASCGGDVDVTLDAGPDGLSSLVGDFLEVGCSTSVVLGLSIEIANEVSCLDPSALTSFDASDDITFSSSAVLPYLSSAGRDDLEASVLANIETVGEPLVINSAFRTVAQQYLLAEWFARGRCGITAAAEPGRSNHESGRAIDIDNYAVWRTALGAFRWEQTVPGDDVHFDHLPSPDNRGLDVLAFQTLWNRSVPDDPISEDGLYGPATAERLRISPADGFGVGPSCGARLHRGGFLPKGGDRSGVYQRLTQNPVHRCGN